MATIQYKNFQQAQVQSWTGGRAKLCYSDLEKETKKFEMSTVKQMTCHYH